MRNKLIESVKAQMKEERETRGILSGISWIVIVAVVVFCEIMYIKIMMIGLPSGLVQLVAIGGAVATGASVILLYAGKEYWFSGKKQNAAAWVFAGVEVTVLVLNVLLAFNFDSPQPIFQIWKQAYPAAPVIALIGWGFIRYFDQTNVMRRKQRKQEEEEHESELDYDALVHQKRMEVKENSLEMLAEKLQDKIESASHQAGLDAIADQIANSILREISGKSLFSAKQPTVIEGSVQAQQTSPLQQPQLDTQTSHAGTNGNK